MDGKILKFPTIKRCTQCNILKPLSAFYPRSTRKCNSQSQCKECEKIRVQKYRLRNVDKLKEQRKKKYKENTSEIIERQSKWYWKNRNIIMERRKQYIQTEKAKTTRKLWKKKNPDKIRIMQKRYLSVPRNRIRANISAKIHHIIKGSIKYHWPKQLGYTFQELKEHLEKLFKDNMSWENYGKYGWHIDHKVPISAFNYKFYSDNAFKECWDLSNLQPLWAKENHRKSNKR